MASRGHFYLSIFCIGSVANFVTISWLSVAMFVPWLFSDHVAVILDRCVQVFRCYVWSCGYSSKILIYVVCSRVANFLKRMKTTKHIDAGVVICLVWLSLYYQ